VKTLKAQMRVLMADDQAAMLARTARRAEKQREIVGTVTNGLALLEVVSPAPAQRQGWRRGETQDHISQQFSL